MSFDALAWAAKQRPGNLAAKMVLLALANYANEHGEAYPSTAAVADFGDMNHKTATAALDRLEALGLIVDTGRKAGRSGQIKVYSLSLQSPPKAEASQKRKPPVFSNQATQKRVTDTIKEPVSSEAKASSERAREKVSFKPFVLPSWIPDEAWNGWLDTRRAMRKAPSRRALDLAVATLQQLHIEGHDLQAVLNQSTLNGWAGLFPLKRDQRSADHGDSLVRAVARQQAMRNAGFLSDDGEAIVPAPAASVAERALEDSSGEAIHSALRGAVGEALYQQWLSPAAFLPSGTEMRVVAASHFACRYIESNFLQQIFHAASAAGLEARSITVSVTAGGATPRRTAHGG
jgi:hypothetical protein